MISLVGKVDAQHNITLLHTKPQVHNEMRKEKQYICIDHLTAASHHVYGDQLGFMNLLLLRE